MAVDRDLYGRGSDAIFGPGAEAWNRKECALDFIERRAARTGKPIHEICDCDLYGRVGSGSKAPQYLPTFRLDEQRGKQLQRRCKPFTADQLLTNVCVLACCSNFILQGDPRIFGPEAHALNLKDAKRKLRKRGKKLSQGKNKVLGFAAMSKFLFSTKKMRLKRRESFTEEEMRLAPLTMSTDSWTSEIKEDAPPKSKQLKVSEASELTVDEKSDQKDRSALNNFGAAVSAPTSAKSSVTSSKNIFENQASSDNTIMVMLSKEQSKSAENSAQLTKDPGSESAWFQESPTNKSASPKESAQLSDEDGTASVESSDRHSEISDNARFEDRSSSDNSNSKTAQLADGANSESAWFQNSKDQSTSNEEPVVAKSGDGPQPTSGEEKVQLTSDDDVAKETSSEEESVELTSSDDDATQETTSSEEESPQLTNGSGSSSAWFQNSSKTVSQTGSSAHASARTTSIAISTPMSRNVSGASHSTAASTADASSRDNSNLTWGENVSSRGSSAVQTDSGVNSNARTRSKASSDAFSGEEVISRALSADANTSKHRTAEGAHETN